MRGRRAAAVAVLATLLSLGLTTSGPTSYAGTAAWEGTSLSATREYASRLLAGVNSRRTKNGLAKLRLGTCIDGFSETWAKTMIDNDLWQHADMGRLMRKCSLSYASENLAAWGSGVAPGTIVSLWMGSDGHRANILSRKARVVGVAVRYDSNRKQFYGVMDFGRR